MTPTTKRNHLGKTAVDKKEKEGKTRTRQATTTVEPSHWKSQMVGRHDAGQKL